MRAPAKRTAALRGEDGMTLVELLVASAMSVILVGAVGSMLISAVRSQPQLSKKAQNVSSARWVLERLTREIRNGIRVDQATTSKVSFLTYVRRTSCGGSVPPSSSPAIKCEVTYECTTTSCSRRETNDGVLIGGTPTTIFSGINSSSVFCYVPSTNPDPMVCGSASATPSTYIGVTLRIPNPSGPSSLSVSDGASLRNATLSN